MSLHDKNQLIAETYLNTIFSPLKYDVEELQNKRALFFGMIHERFTDEGLSLRDSGDNRLGAVLSDLHKMTDKKSGKSESRYISMYPSSGTQSRPRFPLGSRGE